jgi:hypothetical protein
MRSKAWKQTHLSETVQNAPQSRAGDQEQPLLPGSQTMHSAIDPIDMDIKILDESIIEQIVQKREVKTETFRKHT